MEDLEMVAIIHSSCNCSYFYERLKVHLGDYASVHKAPETFFTARGDERHEPPQKAKKARSIADTSLRHHAHLATIPRVRAPFFSQGSSPAAQLAQYDKLRDKSRRCPIRRAHR